jgi:hypothetical protein
MCDLAIALAKESVNEHVPTFVYISAAAGSPILPARYISTKREAEATITSKLPDLRSVFIRPGFMYDSSRKFTLPIAMGGFVASELNTFLGNKLGFLGLWPKSPSRPISSAKRWSRHWRMSPPRVQSEQNRLRHLQQKPGERRCFRYVG